MPANAPLAPFPWIDVLIIVALWRSNGVFAMSELAVVSARKPPLKAMARADAGARGRRWISPPIPAGSCPRSRSESP